MPKKQSRSDLRAAGLSLTKTRRLASLEKRGKGGLLAGLAGVALIGGGVGAVLLPQSPHEPIAGVETAAAVPSPVERQAEQAIPDRPDAAGVGAAGVAQPATPTAGDTQEATTETAAATTPAPARVAPTGFGATPGLAVLRQGPAPTPGLLAPPPPSPGAAPFGSEPPYESAMPDEPASETLRPCPAQGEDYAFFVEMVAPVQAAASETAEAIDQLRYLVECGADNIEVVGVVDVGDNELARGIQALEVGNALITKAAGEGLETSGIAAVTSGLTPDREGQRGVLIRMTGEQ